MSINHIKDFNECKNSLTEFQKGIHNPGDTSLGINHPENKISTPFLNVPTKTTYFHHFKEKLPANLDVLTSKVIYTANSKYHGLSYVNLDQMLPYIKLKEGYEGRWIENIGSNIFKIGTVELNNQIIQTIDQTFNDFNLETMIIKDVSYDKDLGNTSLLQNWSRETPSDITSFTIPWFYSDK
jgi:hypothetical protein